MSSPRIALILAYAAYAAVPCFAEGRKTADYALIGHDALARQILSAVVSKPNSGIQSFAALGSGQGIKLEAPKAVAGLRDSLNDRPALRYDASAGLKPHAGLLPKPKSKAKGSRIGASTQLRKLNKQGLNQDWGEDSKNAGAPADRKSRPSL